MTKKVKAVGTIMLVAGRFPPGGPSVDTGTVSVRHRPLTNGRMQEIVRPSRERRDGRIKDHRQLPARPVRCLQSCTDVLNEIVERNVNLSRDCIVVSQ
jgi:hypothetical protein